MVKATTRKPLKKGKIVFRDIGDEAVLYTIHVCVLIGIYSEKTHTNEDF